MMEPGEEYSSSSDNDSGDDDQDSKKKYDTRKDAVTIDLHLNSPITHDDIKFIYTYLKDGFHCKRHNKIKTRLDFYTEEGINHKPYYDEPGCPWSLLEEFFQNFPDSEIKKGSHKNASLNYLIENAVINTSIHHSTYYDNGIDPYRRLETIKKIMQDQDLHKLYEQKIKVERIKEQISLDNHTLGTFSTIGKNFQIEKEISFIFDERTNTWLMFPTPMIMCVLDNLQAEFYILLHILIKESLIHCTSLKRHYMVLKRKMNKLREKLGKDFFDIVKDWDAFCIGNIVKRPDDLEFTTLYDSLLEEWKELIKDDDLLNDIVDLMTCQDIDTSIDGREHLSLYFSNLAKFFGHPILEPQDGIEVIRENTKKIVDVDHNLAQSTLWMFRKTFFINFFKKRGHYPKHYFIEKGEAILLKEIIQDERIPTKEEEQKIPLSDWEYICSDTNFSLNDEIDEKEILKDTACAPERWNWFVPYDPCAFKHLYNQRKPKSSAPHEPRVLARYLKGDPNELAIKIHELQNFIFNHSRDDIVQLCRKEQELNKNGRCYCKQPYIQRMLQVAMEKALSDNILPFIKEQTMTNSELEVTKRMNKVASTIGAGGRYNVNLDLSKWNQLQRDELNKYIFEELDSLHGLHNVYSDSHRWFNRCMVLLNSRLSPPKIGIKGEPEEGPFCHYNQFGGFEGMRQKAWTITTIMIIKIALDQNKLKGDIMGQGDNQVIHLYLDMEQNFNPKKTIKLFLNTLDHLFNLSGLKLKLSETWYSGHLFEYSKVRYLNSIRVDDSLKRLRRLISDINEGFPSINSHLTTVSTCTENLSRNANSPLIPFFIYSLEASNVFQRKNLLDPVSDKIRVLVLLNMPIILGGLPVSNIFQHAQRGWSDNLTIWIKILKTWYFYRPKVFQVLCHIMPMEINPEVDPVSIVEDMYSLNIKKLPNFEREARDLVEKKLPKYVTNPNVLRYLRSTRTDLTQLCKSLISMRPYIANLAHEILRNSNQGICLQLLSSFTNVSTINRMIFEEGFESGRTMYHIGMRKERQAINLIKMRFSRTDSRTWKEGHLLYGAVTETCSSKAAFNLREQTWGFPIEGITSPIPAEQVTILNFDDLSQGSQDNCIIAKTSEALQTYGELALSEKGPYPAYFGSPTSDKMLRPKLTLINPTPETKAIKKLYFILSFLTRTSPHSSILKLIEEMIREKIKLLPEIFQQVPLEDWCGKNYGGSYEHRFHASSQKRSALYSLNNNITTHININTNQLGKALRGDEDYNIFFQEIFLYIQNWITELAVSGRRVYDTYGIVLSCPECTYKIETPEINLLSSSGFRQISTDETTISGLLSQYSPKESQMAQLAVSIHLGRQLIRDSSGDITTHSFLESIGIKKEEASEGCICSNFMTEFRGADFDYLLVGMIQGNFSLVKILDRDINHFPNDTLEQLTYLLINSDRLQEFTQGFNVKFSKHSHGTQQQSLKYLIRGAIKDKFKQKKRNLPLPCRIYLF
ncbi:MAG: RNA-dependent RNA polymerase [Guiyang xinmovirus 1]|nr:MAG: RNA-dependent RNA polymerase [Guiyang xinmovirus 1]